VIALVRLPRETYSDELPENPGANLLLLEDVQDPGNVGTLIRTAAAFDFSAIILSEKCADPFSAKCAQSSAGSVLSIAIRRTKNYLSLAENLRRRGYLLVSADLSGFEKPEIVTTSKKMVLALGNEASGLSQALLDISDFRVRIPINTHKVESLNVAACGAILMYLSGHRSNNL
jgi:TrmH family RNA methyltransferase